MTQTDSPPPERKRRRFWVSLGEAAAVASVAIAALSYWESHREHAKAARDTQAQATARTVIMLEGAADAHGRRLLLQPVKSGQIIQSQTYVFPSEVLGHAMEIVAARPQIDGQWIAAGLGRALDRAHVKGNGEARLPVGIVTRYEEDGESRTDRSVYEMGYAWRSKFLVGREIVLQGISLDQRGAGGDLQDKVNRRWRPPHASGSAPT
jgi:hypothetical protein